MRRGRIVALALVGLALTVALLDWTIGAFDALQISRQADARRARAAMRAIDGTASLAFAAGFDAHLGRSSFRLTTGPAGERVPRAGTAPASDALRILVVGGGAALGWGVDDELTFARGLEQARAADGKAVAVVNAAQLFAAAVDPVALAAHWLPVTGPDVVLLCGPTRAGTPDPVLRGIGAGAGQHAAWIARVLPSLWELDRALGGELSHDAAAAPAPPGEDDRRAAYEQAVARCRERSVRPVVVDLGGEPSLPAWCDALAVDRVDARLTADDLRSPVFVDWQNGWPNAFGHDRIGARLARGLAALGILAAPD